MLAPVVLAMLVALPFASPPPAGQAGATQQPPATVAPQEPEKPWPPAGVVRAGSGIVSPRLVKEAKPRYTLAAMQARIEGTIWMEAVVEPDGTVGEVRVMTSLDREHGLDDEAVATVKRWRFAAGKKDGVGVPVLVEIQMTFSLRK